MIDPDELTTPTTQPANNIPDTAAFLPPKPSFIQRARRFLVIFGAFYVTVVILLAIPYFQSHVVYLHAVRLPFFADFTTPEKYGLAPNKTLNLRIQTSDNESIGAWFILSDSYYHSLQTIPASVSEHITEAVQRHPTILFLHGNAATRAFSARIQHYATFTSRLSANVLVIDYRGFADSTGQPSQNGLVLDARAAWDWLVAHGTKSENIIVIGHSLGTGVASQFAAQFGHEGIRPRGIVLLAPFSSIRTLLDTYHLFGFLPLAKPLSMIPFGSNFLTWCLVHTFDSLSVTPDITGNVVIAHAINDWDIPYTHSEVLFEALLGKHIPSVDVPLNPMGMTKQHWDTLLAQRALRMSERKRLVKHTDLLPFGTLDEFDDGNRKVTFVKTQAGGHDYIGAQEGVQDVIGRALGLL